MKLHMRISTQGCVISYCGDSKLMLTCKCCNFLTIKLKVFDVKIIHIQLSFVLFFNCQFVTFL